MHTSHYSYSGAFGESHQCETIILFVIIVNSREYVFEAPQSKIQIYRYRVSQSVQGAEIWTVRTENSLENAWLFTC
jgi:hypothetical protein